MVQIVTRERFALWGVMGIPAFFAISTTLSVLQIPQGPGWGVEINPAWLAKAKYQISEI